MEGNHCRCEERNIDLILTWDESLSMCCVLPRFLARVGNRVPLSSCSVAVRLHAGTGVRVFSVTATRIDDHPEMPMPAEIIRRTREYGQVDSEGNPVLDSESNQILETRIANVEHRLKTEVVSDGCTVMPDGCSKKYSIHLRWTYGLENPLRTDSADLFLPVIESPVLKSTFAQDSLNPLTYSNPGMNQLPKGIGSGAVGVSLVVA
jgi:hypothetical protein